MNFNKSAYLPDDIYQYLVDHSARPDSILQELIEKTSGLGDISIMQIAPEQGAFMTILARLIHAKRAIESGTFTGYSAICIARGLANGGTLLCCDVSQEWTDVARSFWEKAGVSSRINLRIGPAISTLRSLPEERNFDMAFIDADKENQPLYYEELLLRIRPGGVILVDNAFAFGGVVDPSNHDKKIQAVRDFNDKVTNDQRVESVMLPIADGLNLLRVI